MTKTKKILRKESSLDSLISLGDTTFNIQGLQKCDYLLSNAYPLIVNRKNSEVILHRLHEEYGFHIKCIIDNNSHRAINRNDLGHNLMSCQNITLESPACKPKAIENTDVLVVYAFKNMKNYSLRVKKQYKFNYLIYVSDYYDSKFNHFLNNIFTPLHEAPPKNIDNNYYKSIYKSLQVNLRPKHYFFTLKCFRRLDKPVHEDKI
eukprot:NODE_1185_length_1872_cov_0.450085.p2 type:complete len:205 gc:universal NODE_1185_length_1872_cov_0.450085:1069-1683(+)